MYKATLKISTVLLAIVTSYGQKFHPIIRPKCCAESFSPSLPKSLPWENILRQATYQSIIRHLDFTGSLDGRLDRDQALWGQLQEAELTEDNNTLGNAAENSETGILKVLHQSEQKLSFEYHKTYKSFYECAQGSCFSNDKALLALWQVRKAENPYNIKISVKLPQLSGSPTEDTYEYSGKHGLKRINQDSLLYPSLKSEKTHRFSLQQNKESIERADFHFPISNMGFGVARINPMFLYDPPAVAPIKTEDGWVISPPRKTHPGVIVDTGRKESTFFDVPPGPYVASEGSNGFRHIIHSLPSIASSQNLDPNQELRGFLPSMGPVRAPSPYKTEYAYDPRYVLYYNKQPRVQYMHTPLPGRDYFKPSTEFVRYSEVDPFFHSEGEELLNSTPMPANNHNFLPVTQNIPMPNDQQSKHLNRKQNFSIPINNDRPPTHVDLTQTSTTKPSSFQIIVDDDESSVTKTNLKSKPSNRVPSMHITKSVQIPKSQTKFQDKPKIVENNKSTTKTFGDKIKPKTQQDRYLETIKPIITRPTPSITGIYNKNIQNSLGGIIVPTTTRYESPKLPSRKVNNRQQSQRSKMNNLNSSTNKKVTKPIIEIKETTTEYETETTNFDFDPQNTEYDHTDNITDSYLESTWPGNKNELETTTSDNAETTITVAENKFTPKNVTSEVDTDSTIYDYYNDEMTESYNDTTNRDFTNSSRINLTSLADDFFTVETTTDVSTTSKTTADSSSQSIDGDTQESKTHNTQYRLLTFPGDTVSIVANRISKTYSYKTANGNVGKLHTKEHSTNKHTFPYVSKDYTTLL